MPSRILQKYPTQKLFGLRVFLISIITATALFLPFIIMGGGVFYYYGDFNVQEIPFYQLVHDAVRNGDMGWMHNVDLGTDMLSSFSFYLLGSPFFWLTIPFPSEAVPYLIGPLLILKFGCASLSAYLYLKRYVADRNFALVGGLLYAFSGFSIYNVFFFHFHEPMIMFPLLLAALDAFIYDGKRIVFTLAVFSACVVNYYFFVGQVLFVIDPRVYKARAEKARAQLHKDEAQAKKAERDLERIRPLYEQNAASRLDLDNAVAAYETAKASVNMSKADVDQAEQELSYTIVRSPISGQISERHVDLGTIVGTEGKSLLATIVKSDTVLVDFSMTALDYLKSKERNVIIGQRDSTRSWQPTVSITLPDNSVYPYRGAVDFAEPQVDPRTGTFSVRAEMPNPGHDLLPGQFTKVKVLLDVREHATVVPQKALTIEKGGAYIFVMRKDSTVERRFIELGPEFGNNVVVERGLAPKEMIVTEGFHKLMPGMKVNAMPETGRKNNKEANNSTNKK